MPAYIRPNLLFALTEWRTGVQGRLILQDEDKSCKQEGDMRRLNTLAHYKVPDGALMALQTKQASMYNMSGMSATSAMRYGENTQCEYSPLALYGRFCLSVKVIVLVV